MRLFVALLMVTVEALGQEAGGQGEIPTLLVSPSEPDARPIDLKQGGQFIEPLCDLIPSITAQQVDGGSFEEEPAFNQGWKREIDKAFRPWYPDGATHLAKLALDAEKPV
jgi:hypothetical protein